MRVAIVFENYGPYHLARASAAARNCEIVAVEFRAQSKIYDWHSPEPPEGLQKITLFADKSPGETQITQMLDAKLSKLALDAICVNGWGDSLARETIRWALQKQIPIVMMSESTQWDDRRVKWKEWIKSRIVKTCSAALAGGTPHLEYLEKLGMPHGRIFLGYDAVDNEYFSKGADETRKQKAESRKRLGLPERYFLASARFIEKKNLPRLLTAYARYLEKAESRKQKLGNSAASLSTLSSIAANDGGSLLDTPTSGLPAPHSLVLLGDGPLKSDLCRLISSLGLQDSVLLPGFVQYPDLPAYYALASAFVHPSTTEQWGLVVNEAMASGLPVLVSNRCGCASDLVQEGINGFTFDPYNIDQITDLMLKISAVNFSLSAFGAVSRKIIANWGPERFAQGLKRAVETAMSVPPVRANWLDKLLLAALSRRRPTTES